MVIFISKFKVPSSYSFRMVEQLHVRGNIIEPLQKIFAYKGVQITAHFVLVFFLWILPYLQDFFGIGATIRIGWELICLTYAGFLLPNIQSIDRKGCDDHLQWLAVLCGWWVNFTSLTDPVHSGLGPQQIQKKNSKWGRQNYIWWQKCLIFH